MSEWFEKIRNFMSKKIITHGLLVTFLVGLTILGNYYFPESGRRFSEKWSTGLKYDENQLKSTNDLSFSCSLPISLEERSRIKAQLLKIRVKANHHLIVMEDFYVNYFSSIVMFSIAGAIAAICLTLISKKGWDQVNEHVITIFLVMSAVTAYYGAMPSSFQQQQNIGDNKVLYLKFVALENEVLSYVATGGRTVLKDQAQNEKPKIVVKDFIYYVDQQLAQDNIAIGFDSSKAPSYASSFNVN